MKKLVLSVVAALAVSTAVPAFAADMPVKALKAPVATSPWDVAFGTAFTSDYVLRGVSQSNHKPAVQGYFELQYTLNDWLKVYAGLWGSSLWTGLANAEFDITAGARLTFGNFGLDVGYIQYEYPGGGVNGIGNFGEIYAKPSYKVNDWLSFGGVVETGLGNNFNGTVCAPASPSCFGGLGVYVGDAKHYYYAGNVTVMLPVPLPYGITTALNAEIGREYYSSGVNANYGFSSDTYWDIGLVFNYKAATLDLRYWDTNIRNPTATYASQCLNGGAGNYCSSRFVATLKFDTAFSLLK